MALFCEDLHVLPCNTCTNANIKSSTIDYSCIIANYEQFAAIIAMIYANTKNVQLDGM